ncbi:response regulator transcription factor [Chitinophaga varians]|uniref:Response regulator transcription factor n=1 Tax=Chitinophaga varians TaxID=2202339 RepID=A0A847RZ86_9BACT|nr:response regulator transcription factor [Chitinophaga varians]NLR68443.1 response regulator transcription factor [Chitinophaga varians]
MKGAKILIIEDDRQDACLLEGMLLDHGYEVGGIANSLQEALRLFHAIQPDLVIIDIFLQGRKDGITFATQISDDDDTRKPFIFLTSAADRNTFEAARLTAPFSYLLKPFNELELQYAIELAVEKFAGAPAGMFAMEEKSTVMLQDIFFIKRGNMLAKISLDDILYIEVEGKYSKIVCSREKYLVQQPLKLILGRLPAIRFVRVHRNYIVNIREVAKVNLTDNEIVLEDGRSVLFSRRYFDDFMRAFDVLR